MEIHFVRKRMYRMEVMLMKINFKYKKKTTFFCIKINLSNKVAYILFVIIYTIITNNIF